MKATLSRIRLSGRGAKRRGPLRMGGLRLAVLWPLVLMLFLTGLNPARAGLPPGWSETGIGPPTGGNSASAANGVWTIAATGANIGGRNDQFNFEYQVQAGDFDVTVCLAALSLS